MTKVVAYRRLSPSGSRTKEERKEALAKQKRRIEEHCDEEDKQLVEMFTDHRSSGRKHLPIQRDEFVDMVDLLVTDESIEEVVVYNPDRVTRQAVTRLSLKDHIATAMWTPGDEYREVDVYATMGKDEEGRYIPSYRKIESQEQIGTMVMELVEGYQTQKSRRDDAMKGQERLNEKVVKGKPPRGLVTDKMLARAEDIDIGDATMFLPAEDAPYEDYMAIISRCHDGESKTAIGREYGFTEGSEWDIVNRIWENRHKYVLAGEWHNRLMESQDPPEWFEGTDFVNIPSSVYDSLSREDLNGLETEMVNEVVNPDYLPWRP